MESARMTLDLLLTVTEGMDYVGDKLNKYDLLNSAIVLSDVVDAFRSIAEAIHSIDDLNVELKSELNIYANELELSLFQLAIAFEEGNATKTLEYYQLAVKPNFDNWRQLVEKILLPLVQM